MPVSDIRQKVDASIRDRLTEKLLDRYIVLHQKWSWRDCPCSFCRHKRVVHTKMQYLGQGFHHRVSIEIIREGQARTYRQQLQEKVQEEIISAAKLRKEQPDGND